MFFILWWKKASIKENLIIIKTIIKDYNSI